MNYPIKGVTENGNPIHEIRLDKIKSPMDGMTKDELINYRKNEFDRLKKENEGKKFDVSNDECNDRGYKIFEVRDNELYIDGISVHFERLLTSDRLIIALALLEGEYMKNKYKNI